MIVFEQFLKDNNCRDQYWQNLQNIKKGGSIKRAIKDNKCLLREISILYITNSFLWKDSKEGHEFWSELDDKWIDLIEDLDFTYFGFGIDYDLEKGEPLC